MDKPVAQDEADALAESTSLDARRGARWVARIGHMAENGHEDRIWKRIRRMAGNADMTEADVLKGLFGLWDRHLANEERTSTEEESQGTSWLLDEMH